jgi:hypothetical protein
MKLIVPLEGDIEIGNSVFVMTSNVYGEPEPGAPFDQNRVVGVYATREAAEAYRDNAIPPVEDAKIVEWGVQV